MCAKLLAAAIGCFSSLAIRPNRHLTVHFRIALIFIRSAIHSACLLLHSSPVKCVIRRAPDGSTMRLIVGDTFGRGPAKALEDKVGKDVGFVSCERPLSMCSQHVRATTAFSPTQLVGPPSGTSWAVEKWQIAFQGTNDCQPSVLALVGSSKLCFPCRPHACAHHYCTSVRSYRIAYQLNLQSLSFDALFPFMRYVRTTMGLGICQVTLPYQLVRAIR